MYKQDNIKNLHKQLKDLLLLTTCIKIIIKKADKGSTDTILTSDFYWNMCKKHLSITEYYEKIIWDQKGQEWLRWLEGLNTLYSMKYSIQFVKLDSLSCSNFFFLFSCVSLDNSKRQRCAWRAFGTRKPIYSS